MSLAARRTQEERSTATRERLLDATIECLVELGYVRTTTTEIVRRAGVSRGAQVHHFPTKAELVRSAVVHLAERREQELREEFVRIAGRADRISAAIDLLWSGYAGPLFAAVLELIVAARTDPELAKVVGSLNINVQRGVEGFIRDTFGAEVLKRKGLRDGLALTLNLMTGLALHGLADGESYRPNELLKTWKGLVRPLFEDKQ